MKKHIYLSILLLLSQQISNAQTKAIVEIDSVQTQLIEGVSFPYWLKAGQTIKPTGQTLSISALEFTIDSPGNNLVFSQVLKITKAALVPAKKVWKIEAVGIASVIPSVSTSPAKFTNPGTYKWTVPPGVSRICVEVWGAGGMGYYAGITSGAYGGAGGGGYGYDCFSVTPGTTYTVNVGAPGDGRGSGGGSSSVGTLISATGGEDGSLTNNVKGGTSSAAFNVPGGNSNGLNGGEGGLGGPGGVQCGMKAGFPGGGSATWIQGIVSSCGSLSAGASGQVIIHW